MDSGNPIATFSVTNLQGIAAATEVKVFHQQNVKWFGSHNSTTQLF